jgi:hypothetical protein
MKTRKTLAGVAAAVAGLAPLSLTLPAEAATYRDGCWVTPQRPENVTPIGSQTAYARYTVRITCNPNRVISVRTQAWEQDNGKPGDSGGDDLISSYSFSPITVGPSGGTYTRSLTRTVPDWDHPDHWVEVYHRVSFQVTSNGVTGSPSAWEMSPVQNLYVPHPSITSDS